MLIKPEIKISILIPVFKTEKYIERCLCSILYNTIINDCEVIIVNDCSPDNSVQVIENVLKKFPLLQENVVLYSHDYNQGSAAARNTALLHARGKYIICVDSDDWVEKDYLEKLYLEAERTSADVVICDLIKEAAHSSVVSIKNEWCSGDCVQNLLSGRLQAWLPVKLIRHSLLIENGINWREGLNMCEDLLIMTKVFFYTKKVVYLGQPLYHYNCSNESSLTFELNEDKVLQLKNVVKEIENFLPNEYINVIKELKCRIKVWILKGLKEPQKSDFEIYNDDLLSRIQGLPLLNRIFFYLCEQRKYNLVRFILNLKK